MRTFWARLVAWLWAAVVAAASASSLRAALAGWWRATSRRTRVVLVAAGVPAVFVAVTAVPAFAAEGGGLLGWTGLKDTQGVPASSYLTLDLDNGGVTKPVRAIWAVLTHLFWSAYSMSAITALWIVDWSLSFEWLSWVSDPLNTVGDALAQVMAATGLGPLLLTITAVLAMVSWFSGKSVLALFEIFLAVTVAALAMGVFSTPVALVDRNGSGMLTDTRDVSMELVGELSDKPQGEDTQDALMAGMITTFLRQPHQLVNFGEVVDGGDCEDDFTTPMREGKPLDVADSVGKCDGDLKDYADDPSANMMTSTWMVGLSGTVLILFAVLLAGSVFMAAISALFHGLTLVVQLILAQGPGGMRGGLWRTVANLAVSLFTVVFTVLFLAVFLQVIQAIFSGNADEPPVKKFLISNILIVVGCFVFWRARKRLKATSERMAEAMAKRPQGSPTRLPAQRTANPSELYHKGRMVMGAGKVAAGVASGGITAAALAGGAAVKGGSTLARRAGSAAAGEADRFRWADKAGVFLDRHGRRTADNARPHGGPAPKPELTAADRVKDKVHAPEAAGPPRLPTPRTPSSTDAPEGQRRGPSPAGQQLRSRLQNSTNGGGQPGPQHAGQPRTTGPRRPTPPSPTRPTVQGTRLRKPATTPTTSPTPEVVPGAVVSSVGDKTTATRLRERLRAR